MSSSAGHFFVCRSARTRTSTSADRPGRMDNRRDAPYQDRRQHRRGDPLPQRGTHAGGAATINSSVADMKPLAPLQLANGEWTVTTGGYATAIRRTRTPAVPPWRLGELDPGPFPFDSLVQS
jgi:hypothetical protein